MERHQAYNRAPTEQDSVHLYSTQLDDSLKTQVLKSLSRANRSIFVRIYGLTDPEVIALLNEKATQGVTISVFYDPKASKSLTKKISPLVKAVPVKGKGIQHQKLWIIDENEVWIGSTNLTTKSLVMHDNLLMGLYAPDLASWVLNYYTSAKHPPLETSFKDSFFLLPAGERPLHKLCDAIDQAEETLYIAMFSWTHKDLCQHVIAAHERGVRVRVVLDPSTVEGVGKKTASSLKKAGIPIHIRQGDPLMHHKFALIDEKLLVTGSANWSFSAFKKNEETLLFHTIEDHKEKKAATSLWKNLWHETHNL